MLVHQRVSPKRMNSPGIPGIPGPKKWIGENPWLTLRRGRWHGGWRRRAPHVRRFRAATRCRCVLFEWSPEVWTDSIPLQKDRKGLWKDFKRTKTVVHMTFRSFFGVANGYQLYMFSNHLEGCSPCLNLPDGDSQQLGLRHAGPWEFDGICGSSWHKFWHPTGGAVSGLFTTVVGVAARHHYHIYHAAVLDTAEDVKPQAFGG